MRGKPDEIQTPVKVIRNGRITIPQAIRETLGIADGDTVLVTIRKIH